MKINYSILLALLVIVASAFTVKTLVTNNDSSPVIETEVKKWTSVEEAFKLSKTDQKKILLDVYTDWCKWCKVMDDKTFSNPEVTAFLAKNYHLAKFNAEQKESLTFKGKQYNFTKNGRRGYHEFAAEILNGRLGYPSLVVFDSELNKLDVIRGYKSPSELMTLLK